MPPAHLGCRRPLPLGGGVTKTWQALVGSLVKAAAHQYAQPPRNRIGPSIGRNTIRMIGAFLSYLIGRRHKGKRKAVWKIVHGCLLGRFYPVSKPYAR